MIANPIKSIIYLHGFRSTSASRKARELGAALQRVSLDWEYITPDLSHDPEVALAQIAQLASRCRATELTLVGSSLGGYYALVCAQRLGCRAVLLNPSLKPYETLASHVGPQTNLHTHETFEFTVEHLESLRHHAPSTITATDKMLLIVEMGDALLDHAQTVAQLSGAQQIVVAGGSHDLDSFPSHIEAVLKHAGMTNAPRSLG